MGGMLMLMTRIEVVGGLKLQGVDTGRLVRIRNMAEMTVPLNLPSTKHPLLPMTETVPHTATEIQVTQYC
jgi:hypothetical protein